MLSYGYHAQVRSRAIERSTHEKKKRQGRTCDAEAEGDALADGEGKTELGVPQVPYSGLHPVPQ